MKTIFAKEKSEYVHQLMLAINLNLHEETRVKAVKRMGELESLVKQEGDELQIIISTINTNTRRTAPPMDMDDIKRKENDGVVVVG